MGDSGRHCRREGGQAGEGCLDVGRKDDRCARRWEGKSHREESRAVRHRRERHQAKVEGSGARMMTLVTDYRSHDDG